jgi:diguanylate cyclase (GGDEF)-like protein
VHHAAGRPMLICPHNKHECITGSNNADESIEMSTTRTGYLSRLRESYFSLFSKIIFCGLKKEQINDIEAQRFVLVINLYSFVGTLYLIFFSIQSLLDAQWGMGSTLSIAALLAITNSIYLQRSGNYRRSGDLIVLMTTLLFLYLIISGGVDNTGPLWSYTLPPLVFFVFGLTQGSLILSVFIFSSILIMFFPPLSILATEYSYSFKIRYLTTFLSVCFISSICEYSRYHSYNLLKELQRKIQLEANTDELTGLYNRRYMYQQLDSMIRKIKRYKRPYSLLLCDLDHFKSINDNHGHSCGDMVLVETANRMKSSLRNEDIAARWGGEEFLIILPETDSTAAFQVAEKLRQQLSAQMFDCNDKKLSISMSIGVLQVNSGTRKEDLLNQVDDALYEAKHLGRNRTHIYAVANSPDE